jgi:hypothetical protein
MSSLFSLDFGQKLHNPLVTEQTRERVRTQKQYIEQLDEAYHVYMATVRKIENEIALIRDTTESLTDDRAPPSFRRLETVLPSLEPRDLKAVESILLFTEGEVVKPECEEEKKDETVEEAEAVECESSDDDSVMTESDDKDEEYVPESFSLNLNIPSSLWSGRLRPRHRLT